MAHGDKTGITALTVAACKGYIEVARALLDADADPNIAHTRGVAPLHLAAGFGHIEIVRALLEAGAVKDFASINGKRPLDVVCGHPNVSSANKQNKAAIEALLRGSQ